MGERRVRKLEASKKNHWIEQMGLTRVNGVGAFAMGRQIFRRTVHVVYLSPFLFKFNLYGFTGIFAGYIYGMILDIFHSKWKIINFTKERTQILASNFRIYLKVLYTYTHIYIE